MTTGNTRLYLMYCFRGGNALQGTDTSTCRSPQKQIDLMNQAILKNTLAAATPVLHPGRQGGE